MGPCMMHTCPLVCYVSLSYQVLLLVISVLLMLHLSLLLFTSLHKHEHAAACRPAYDGTDLCQAELRRGASAFCPVIFSWACWTNRASCLAQLATFSNSWNSHVDPCFVLSLLVLARESLGSQNESLPQLQLVHRWFF